MPAPLKSTEFRREREASWRELEGLVAKAERRGVTALDADELMRLPTLYRSALSSLSVARAVSLDRNVVEYLEALAGRAYFLVYGTRHHLRAALRDFFGVRFPGAVRRFRGALYLALTTLALGAATGFLLTADAPERFYAFVDPTYAQGRDPTAATEALKSTLYDYDDDAAETLSTFASFLFSHNARIGMLAFALGFAAGIPVFLLLFKNGLLLGAFAALFHGRGLGVDFWGWVLPHGVTELLAVLLCGAAGLVIGQALVFPGRRTRLEQLTRRGREAGVIVIGAVVLFFVAALIEGVFRQRVDSVPSRYLVVVLSATAWLVYFTRAGRRSRP